MNSLYRILLAAFILAGCGPAPATPAPLSITLVSVEDRAAPNVVSASGVLLPALRSNIAFNISAPVKEVFVGIGDEVKAGETLIVLDTPELKYSAAAAEAELHLAELEVIISRYKKKKFNEMTGKIDYVGGPPESRQKADAKLQRAQAELAIAQANLAQGTMVAPYDGTIVDVNIKPSETVQPGQVVITIGDLTTLQVETTDLSERDVPYVNVGQRARVYIEALNIEVDGTVSAISPISNEVGGDVVFKITIKLDEFPDGLLWGMSAEVDIGTTQ